FNSTMTRFIRLGTKKGEPTWRSEMWAIVTTSSVYDHAEVPGRPCQRAGTVVWDHGTVGFLDLVIVAWAVLAAVSGYRRGATVQLTEYVGLCAGLAAGALLAAVIAALAPSPLWRALSAGGPRRRLAGGGGRLGG